MKLGSALRPHGRGVYCTVSVACHRRVTGASGDNCLLRCRSRRPCPEEVVSLHKLYKICYLKRGGMTEKPKYWGRVHSGPWYRELYLFFDRPVTLSDVDELADYPLTALRLLKRLTDVGAVIDEELWAYSGTALPYTMGSFPRRRQLHMLHLMPSVSATRQYNNGARHGDLTDAVSAARKNWERVPRHKVAHVSF